MALTSDPSCVPSTRRVFSFSGAGWLGFHQFGVAKAFYDTPSYLRPYAEGADPADRDLYVGASAGSLTAAVLAAGIDPSSVQSMWLAAHQLSVEDLTYRFRLGQIVQSNVDALRPALTGDPMWRQRMKHSVGIYVLYLRNGATVGLSDFANFGELNEALCASCNLPGFAGAPVKITQAGGARAIDGGLLYMQPLSAHPNAVNVCPFWQLPSATRPSYTPTSWAVWPPRSNDDFAALFPLGVNDGLSYLASSGAISVDEAAARRIDDVRIPTWRFGRAAPTLDAFVGHIRGRVAARRAIRAAALR